MKITKQFILREVVGENVLIPVGDTALQFNGIISLNPVAAVIWKRLQDGADRQQLLDAILEEFDVTPEQASADLDEFLQLLLKNSLVDDIQ